MGGWNFADRRFPQTLAPASDWPPPPPPHPPTPHGNNILSPPQPTQPYHHPYPYHQAPDLRARATRSLAPSPTPTPAHPLHPPPSTPTPLFPPPAQPLTPRLQICGLELRPDLAKRGIQGCLGWDGDSDEEQRIAAALGYVALVTERLAGYLDVPLRFPLRIRASRSAVMDPAPVHQQASEEHCEYCCLVG